MAAFFGAKTADRPRIKLCGQNRKCIRAIDTPWHCCFSGFSITICLIRGVSIWYRSIAAILEAIYADAPRMRTRDARPGRGHRQPKLIATTREQWTHESEVMLSSLFSYYKLQRSLDIEKVRHIDRQTNIQTDRRMEMHADT